MTKETYIIQKDEVIKNIEEMVKDILYTDVVDEEFYDNLDIDNNLNYDYEKFILDEFYNKKTVNQCLAKLSKKELMYIKGKAKVVLDFIKMFNNIQINKNLYNFLKYIVNEPIKILKEG